MWWTLTEQVELTVSNFGQELNRTYNLDCSFTLLDSKNARHHWKFIHSLIDPSPNRDSIYEALVVYINGLQVGLDTRIDTDFFFQTAITNSVGAQLAKSQLDNKEMAALFLLLITRPACREIAKSDRTRRVITELRNRTLAALAAHLNTFGKNVDERMGQIIFLISDFQGLGRLVRHSVRLLMTATNFRAAPKEFLSFFERQLGLYNKYAVF